MNVIIVCAGESSRWNNYLGCRKHLVKIDGERLIDRTVRLIEEYARGEYKIFIVAPNDDYKSKGAELFIPKKDESIGEADKFLNSKELWNRDGRTLYLLGDVWYSEEAMRTICGHDRHRWTVFGRFKRSSITGCRWREYFALSFHDQHIKRHEESLHRIIKMFKDGRLKKCGGWELSYAMGGIPIFNNSSSLPEKIFSYIYNRLTSVIFRLNLYKGADFVSIDDWTEDFDYPEDYDTWMSRKYEGWYVLRIESR